MNKFFAKGIEIIKQGGIVIFPTDTAFGIGCRIDNEAAIRKLFALKKRSLIKAPPVLFSSVKMVEDYVLPIPEIVKTKLIDHYWPGALTIVLPAFTDKISPLVRGERDTIGTRIPNLKDLRLFIENIGIPIIGTSANFNGEPTAYRMSDLDNNLLTLVDYVVPGVCRLKQSSTVIDCSVSPWKVLRQGALRIEL